MRSKRFRFQISLPSSEYLRYYKGDARALIVRSEEGQRISLPANSLRTFVGPSGVYGRFEITLDGNNKLIDIHRL